MSLGLAFCFLIAALGGAGWVLVAVLGLFGIVATPLAGIALLLTVGGLVAAIPVAVFE